MRSTFEVTSHIIDEKHKVNIKTPIPDTVIDNTVCRYDSGYVIISNVIVSDLQWNCISLKECMLCRQSIVPSIIKNHIYSTPHVINLIHSRIYKNEDSYYRKVRFLYSIFL
ncbi:unnamed protein product [Diatraea saccharalis]|uniref:Uncharacterized protein n=1 Tax=Diatraea saccharalis TaxID=40085 RepID=A0A9N9RDZ0_9NEOP|nr:unnamed protein product [Diatraea saccharalis]